MRLLSSLLLVACNPVSALHDAEVALVCDAPDVNVTDQNRASIVADFAGDIALSEHLSSLEQRTVWVEDCLVSSFWKRHCDLRNVPAYQTAWADAVRSQPVLDRRLIVWKLKGHSPNEAPQKSHPCRGRGPQWELRYPGGEQRYIRADNGEAIEGLHGWQRPR